MRWMAGSQSQWWAVLVLLAGVCLPSFGASSAKESKDTRREADIQTAYYIDKAGEKAAVSIVTDQRMDFGQVADHSGSVILGLSDAIISDPAFIHYGGLSYSGICTITGDPNTAVDVTITPVASNGLSLSNFTSSEGDIPLVAVNLDGLGELVLTIGATLTVDGAQANIGANQSVAYTITTTYN